MPARSGQGGDLCVRQQGPGEEGKTKAVRRRGFCGPALLFHLLCQSVIPQGFIEPLACGIVHCAENVMLNCPIILDRLINTWASVFPSILWRYDSISLLECCED